MREKNDKRIEYPIEGLEMGQYIIGPQKDEHPVYDLYAVSVHSGGLGGGHYTAYAKVRGL